VAKRKLKAGPFPRGVIFDMDGVLCDSEPFIAEAAGRMFAELHGITVRAGDFEPFVGAGENRYLGGVAEKYGAALDLERDKRRTYELYLELIRGRLQPLAGVREFLAFCRARGLKLAVATSADLVKLRGNLTEVRLPPESFDALVNGLEVKRRKPDPEIFLLAAERLSLPARDCLVVEDAPNGARAAKAAGSPCLGLTTSFTERELRAAGADWIAPDLARVPAGIFVPPAAGGRE
jgi:HAD superfamily hydrolase (TIGR01509 family)